MKALPPTTRPMRSHLAALLRDFLTLYRYGITPAGMRQIARRRLGL